MWRVWQGGERVERRRGEEVKRRGATHNIYVAALGILLRLFTFATKPGRLGIKARVKAAMARKLNPCQYLEIC